MKKETEKSTESLGESNAEIQNGKGSREEFRKPFPSP
jgi:hypothetical protein